MSDHFVYVIAVDGAGERGPVKIGTSQNPEKRLRELQTASPYRLILMHQFAFPSRDIARTVEKSFHQVLARYNSVGEWVSMPASDAVYFLHIAVDTGLHVNTSLSEQEIADCLYVTGLSEATRYYNSLRMPGLR
jgi:alanine racemase